MSSRAPKVLVVDDHVEMARLLADQLGDLGYEVVLARDGHQALELAREGLPDVVLTDVRMPRVDGMELLDALRELEPTLPVIVMTAFGGADLAVEALRRGAFQYLTKPFRLEEVRVVVERAVGDRRLRRENASLRRLADERSGLPGLVGRSPALQQVVARIERAAPSTVPVLIRGESGTGKELVARALHAASRRSSGPFVSVNCSALPASLLESELFGHGRGAFTGATTPRRGLFVEADGGTLFLDEIGDMAIELQSRLLRVLEDGQVRAVGSDRPRGVDVRVVAATHQPLEARIKEGRFREDLFFRLNVLPLTLPPLRERIEDLPALLERFLEEAREAWPEMVVRSVSADALAALSRRPWPGNVRELRNLVHRLSVMVDHPVVRLSDLDRLELDGQPLPPAGAIPGPAGLFGPALAEAWTLKQLEDAYIDAVMEHCGGNRTRAARLLGVDPSTLYRRGRGPRSG